MISAIQNFVRATDAAIARAYLSLFKERNALMPFLFHSLFRNEAEMDQHVVEPLERTTIAQFRQFIEYYLGCGYRFVSPDDLLQGLAADGKYAMITFDDGYFNNRLALPILEEFKVPALFFISTDHIRENKCFWWDVLYRERHAMGASRSKIYKETVAIKGQRTEQIETELLARFGPNAFKPRGDIDRPFSPTELRQFAASPYVFLGNHTADHAILTNYTPEQVRDQLRGAQEALREIAGVNSVAIAYPNGAHNQDIVHACQEIGLKIGFTVRPQKAAVPFDPQHCDLLRIGRFCPNGADPILKQCRTYRSDLQLYGKFRSGYLRLLRGQVAQMNNRARSIEIELIRGEQAWRMLADDALIVRWSALRDGCPWSTTFQLPGYVRTWYECYRESYEPVLLVSRNEQGALTGLFTLAFSSDGRLVVAGDVQAEYQAWVCSAELGDAFATQALREIRRHFPAAVLRLNYLPPGAPTAWLERAPAKGLHLLKAHRRPLKRFGDGSEIAASLAKRTNKNRLRQIEKRGQVAFDQITDPQQMESILDAMIPLHDARHLTVRGSAPFMDGLVRKSFALALMKVPGLLHVTLFKAGEHLVAAHMGAINKKEVQLGLVAYNPRFAHHSPGKFQINFLARMLMQQGFEQLDLTAGGDPYKERFADAWDQVHTLTLFPTRLSFVRGVVTNSAKETTRALLKLMRLSPNRVRSFADKVKSFRPLSFAANLVGRARKWLASQIETRIYSYPAASAAKLNIPDPIRSDAIDDLLKYQSTASGPLLRSFVSAAITRLEEGQRVYTRAENGRLVHCSFLAERLTEELTNQLLPGFALPADSALIVDLQSLTPDRAAELDTLSLRTMLRDAANIPKTRNIYITAKANNTQLIRLIEEAGFVYEGSVHSRTRFGQKRDSHTAPQGKTPAPKPTAPIKNQRKELVEIH